MAVAALLLVGGGTGGGGRSLLCAKSGGHSRGSAGSLPLKLLQDSYEVSGKQHGPQLVAFGAPLPGQAVLQPLALG